MRQIHAYRGLEPHNVYLCICAYRLRGVRGECRRQQENCKRKTKVSPKEKGYEVNIEGLGRVKERYGPKGKANICINAFFSTAALAVFTGNGQSNTSWLKQDILVILVQHNQVFWARSKWKQERKQVGKSRASKLRACFHWTCKWLAIHARSYLKQVT